LIGVETRRLLGDYRLIGRPQEALLCAKVKRQRQCFICAKAKRQQQMFYLRESEATAANVLSARKRQSAKSYRKSASS